MWLLWAVAAALAVGFVASAAQSSPAAASMLKDQIADNMRHGVCKPLLPVHSAAEDAGFSLTSTAPPGPLPGAARDNAFLVVVEEPRRASAQLHRYI